MVIREIREIRGFKRVGKLLTGVELIGLHLFRAHNHLAHQLGHDGLGLVGGFLHLLMAHLDRVVEAA
jgi:hypothetical protein